MSRGTDPLTYAAFQQYVVRPAVFLHFGFSEPITVCLGNRAMEMGGLLYKPAPNIKISDIVEKLDGSQPQLEITVDNLQPGDALAPTEIDPETTEVQVISYTGSDQPIVAPTDAVEFIAHMWGAGGGPDIREGGQGGYTRIHRKCTAGDKFVAVVGQGGVNITTVYGFGGTGQGTAHQHNGGGLTGLFEGDGPVLKTDFTRAIGIAGGGGAGSWNGSSGTKGTPGNSGYAGGGADFHGTDATGTISTGLGGSGGGWRGGVSVGQWGNGGSGYARPGGLSAPQILGASYPDGTVPGRTLTQYGDNAGQSGTSGRMVIEWVRRPTAAHAVDVPVLVYFGALDADGVLVGAPQLLFSGKIQDLDWDYGADSVSAQISLIGADSIVEATTGQRYTTEGQQRKYPGDKGLEYIAALQDFKLHWGL